MTSVSVAWQWKPTLRCRSPDDPFFEEGNLACQLQYNKHFCIDYESPDGDFNKLNEFLCQQQNCNKTFTSVLDYEMHYNSVHRHSCHVCFRCLPNQHLLDLHLLEQHDQMFQLSAVKKPMFKCLLENCPVIVLTSEERKEHLVSVHKYPANFRFINLGKPPKKLGKQEKHSKVENSSSISDTKTSAVEEMETEELHLGASVATRKFQPRVPKNISFGHGVSRGFHRPNSKQRNPWQSKSKNKNTSETVVSIEDVRMDDLAEVLNAT